MPDSSNSFQASEIDNHNRLVRLEQMQTEQMKHNERIQRAIDPLQAQLQDLTINLARFGERTESMLAVLAQARDNGQKLIRLEEHLSHIQNDILENKKDGAIARQSALTLRNIVLGAIAASAVAGISTTLWSGLESRLSPNHTNPQFTTPSR